MNINHPIEIDFLEFFKTGKFDYLKLGQTKEWILNNFPEPDSTFENKKGGFDIWAYGDLELHFKDNQLILIFSDYWSENKINAGNHILLKPWIFEDTSKLTLNFVLKALNTNHIDYTKKTTSLSIVLYLENGIELTFESTSDIANSDPNNFKLSAFGLKEK